MRVAELNFAPARPHGVAQGEFSPAPSVTVAARSGWLVRLWERLSGRVGSQRQSLPA